MSIETDVQKLAPGAIVTFYILDATEIGGGEVRFQGFDNEQIFWQSDAYQPWPINAEGFAKTGGQQPTPKLQVGNVDGSVSVLCLMFEDLVGAKLIRKRTFVKYLDSINFPEGNPDVDPTQEFPQEVWYIERKSHETTDFVEFELSSALNFAGVQLPRRQIIANQCNFTYRGPYCNYTGPAVAKVTDEATSDMSEDRCGKRLRSCKLRPWPDGVLNFGGFAAAGLVRT